MPSQVVQLPEHEIRSLAKLGTVDREKRTVDVVWSTGYRGLRRGWDGPYYEELSMEPKHVDLSRLNAGASVLDTHSRWDLKSIIGVVEKAWIRDGEGHATLRLSDAEGDRDTVTKILDGIIRNISVGYSISKMVEVERIDDVPVLRAEKWQPHEISFVPVGFDPGSQSRSDENTLTPCTVITTKRNTPMDELEKMKAELRAAEEAKKAAEDAKRAAEAKAEELRAHAPNADEILKKDRERVRAITDVATKHGFDMARAQEFITSGKTIEEFRGIVLDDIATRDLSSGTRSPVMPGQLQEKDTLIRGAEEAILLRVAPTLVKPTELSQRFRSAGLIDIVRDLLEANGTRTFGMSKGQIAERGFHTTSDFPLVLGNALRATLKSYYDTAPSDYDWMTRTITVNDYKPLMRYGLSQGPAFLEVKEHGEYENGTITEAAEQMAIRKYGRKFSVTREVLINDDLNAFGDLARMWSFGAAQLKARLVWEQITSNPVMGDGQPLFSVAHANVLAGAPALDATSLEAAVIALENQKGFSAPGEDTQYLGIKARYLIVGPQLKYAALRLTTAIDAITLNTINLFSDLVVKTDPRLTGDQWYVSADPAGLDAIGILQLRGEEGPQLSERIGFDVDGIDYKARFDVAAKMLDYKWIVKGK